MIIGTQSYPWIQYFNSLGSKLDDHLDEALAAVKRAGLDGWECSIPDKKVGLRIQELLAKHGLALPSIYVMPVIHDGNIPERIEEVVAQALLARSAGAGVVVCNPMPIFHNGIQIPKNDMQLRVQARALEELGHRLRNEGMRLSYHVHAPEMANAAREFHHMLQATDPDDVGFCLDTHWIFRGSGNSNVALMDIVKLYGTRVASLHVRQSQNGVWTEHLCDGDVEHEPVFSRLRHIGFDGPVIIETAFEEGTPRTLTMEDSHRKSREWLAAHWQ